MKKRLLVACAVFATTAFFSQAAFAFPLSTEETEYGSWAVDPDDDTRVVVETSYPDASAKLAITHFTSMGVALQSVDFTISWAVFAEDGTGPYKKLVDKPARKAISISVDGKQVLKSAYSSYGLSDEWVSLRFSFTPMADDDGELEPDEPNCQVINAIRNASEITVTFPEADGTMTERTFSGQGSSRALASLGVCR